MHTSLYIETRNTGLRFQMQFSHTHMHKWGKHETIGVYLSQKYFLIGYLEDATYKTFLSGISEKEKQKSCLCT